jgi:hypothetical protein
MEKCKQHNMKGWEKQTKGKTLTAVLNEKSDFTMFTWPLNKIKELSSIKVDILP